MALTENPRYERKNDSFGREVRLVIEKDNIEIGALKRHSRVRAGETSKTTWEAFGNFGRVGLNKPGFESEEMALKYAEKWLQDCLDSVSKALQQGIAADPGAGVI